MGETIKTISPSTRKPILERSCLSEADVDPLIQRSTEAFKRWRDTNLNERIEVIRKALKALEQKTDALSKELTEQMGRPIAFTSKEIITFLARAEYLLKISTEVLADSPGAPEAGFKRYLKRVPVGPVVIIFAWNYPYLILVNSLIPALLSGNTVILKPSPQTPTIVEHIQETFQSAGLPDGVIQYFHTGSPDLVKKFVQHPQIKLICFTGSVAGGMAIRAAASSRIVPVLLELGGKDPAYVRSDVDVAWAAEEIVDGAVFNSGQSCCSLERIYVHESIHDQFVEKIKAVLADYVLGDPMDSKTHVGPVISAASKTLIESHISEALSKGAKRVPLPNQSFETPPKEGNYVAPTVLTHVTHNMRVMTEETFGPVIPIMKVSSDEQAISLMNDTEFGLTASIWTKDTHRGEELAQRVEAGTCFVNRCDFPSPDLAWTGFNTKSGMGVSLSRYGFDAYTKVKSLHVKEYPK